MLEDVKYMCSNKKYNTYMEHCNDENYMFDFEIPYYDWKLGVWEKETFTLNSLYERYN